MKTLTTTSKPSLKQFSQQFSTQTSNQSSTQSSEQTLKQSSAQIPIFLTTHPANHLQSSSAQPPKPLKPLEPPQALHLDLAAAPVLEQLLARMQKTQTPEKKEDLQPTVAWSLPPLALSTPPALHASSLPASRLQLLESQTSQVYLKIIKLSPPKFQQN